MARQKVLDGQAFTKLVTPARRGSARQTPAEVLSVMQQLSAMIGAPLLRIARPRP
jgi:hypothetical protein